MASNLIRSLFAVRGLQSFSGSVRAYSVMYTAHCTATGGRDGRATCDDNPAHLDVKLVKPKEMGGSGGQGTNPEELFAAGYSACFLGAMGLAAKNLKKNLPSSTTVNAAVSLGKHDNGNLGLKIQLTAKLPGANQADADSIVQAAHQICPYSRKNDRRKKEINKKTIFILDATRNNVDVNVKATV